MNPALERHREQFEADPTQVRSFEVLEEHLFLEGRWDDLVALYRHREGASDLAAKPAVRARLRFREGQILEERCSRSEDALAAYRQSARLAPDFQPALRRLRALHAERGQWELALQVAELEGRTPMRPVERAAFHAEVGEMWLERLGEAEEALALFERALHDDARSAAGLRGRARCLEALGRPTDAVVAWERAAVGLPPSPERGRALAGVARLLAGPLGDPPRAVEAYARALAEAPDDLQVLDAAAALYTELGRSADAASLAERRFALEGDAQRRAAIALEAAHLAGASPDDTARWLERAAELRPDDPRIHLSRAQAAGRVGDFASRAESLERAAALAPDAIDLEQRIELADLRSAEGDFARAGEHLRAALARDPARIDLIDALVALHERSGEAGELVELLEARAALAPDGPTRAVALGQVGALHERQGADLEAALDCYRRAFEAHAGAPGVATALERLLRKAEAWGELRSVLETARRSAPPGERADLDCALGELLLGPLAGSDDGGAAARAAFEEALDLAPTSSRALAGLGRLADATGDEATLLAVFARELEVCGDPAREAWLLRELASRHEARGELAMAATFAARRALREPEDRDALLTSARLWEALGQDGELAAVLERLATLCVGAAKAEVLRKLARVRARRGDPAGELDALEAAASADPDDADALRELVEPLARSGRNAELVRVLRRLAELAPPPEHAACLDRAARLLADELDDPDGAIVVLWRLVDDPDAPADAAERLERLLERTHRFGELAQRLADRRQRLAADTAEASDLDLRRAQVLRTHLAQFGQAAPLYRSVYECVSSGDRRSGDALDGLEACARGAGDDAGLAWVLGERAARAGSEEEAARLTLERATLLDERLDRGVEARALYAQVADGANAMAASANERLVRALERVGDWPGLRARLETSLVGLAPADAIALHERVVQLCLDRLGDRDGAIAHLQSAARLAPERPGPWGRLADLHDGAGRPADARAALEAELATGPASEREIALRVRAARHAEALGEPAAAVTHLERVLSLDPGHAEAVSLLAERYQREGRTDELLRLLRGRLAALEPSDRERATAVRVRLAELLAQVKCDPAGAIEVLAPAATDLDAGAPDGLGAAAVAANPLADLYLREGRMEELAALAARCARATRDPGARADWLLRLGAATRARGDRQAAIDAYRDALGQRPGDLEGEAALRELYRETGDAEALARLLEARLALVTGPDEVPLRVELADLLAGPLAHPTDALLHLRRVLEIDPFRDDARERAIALAEAHAMADLLLELLDGALAKAHRADARAALLHRRATVLAGPLGRLPDAVAAWREAVALAPGDRAARQALRAGLEQIGDFRAYLDELQGEAREASGAQRVELLEKGARIAAEHVSPDASLAWLERLRAERSADPEISARIAEVHRRAGRPEALLRALETEIALRREGERRVALQLETARILEHDLGSRTRALAVLESARAERQDAPAVLAELDRLYRESGRPRERAEILQHRIAVAPPAERGPLHRALAELLGEALGDPARAASEWAAALEHGAGPRAALLQARGRALRIAGRVADWVAVAEEELAALGTGDPVFAERRCELHRELAQAYARELGDPDAALAHLRALADGPEPDPDDELAAEERDGAETALLEVLRSEGADAELERRLASRLARRGDDLAGWLELARVREERLHAPSRAAEAYAAALEHDPNHVEALRGLRRVAERRGDWSGVAVALERELAARPDAPARDRAMLLRRLGDVAWQRLQSTARARRAYTGALELVPGDLAALRSLEHLLEATEDWRGAADLYDLEVERLGDGEPERRRAAHLRVAEFARVRLDDPRRAVEALERAARIAPLVPADRRTLAALLRASGELPRCVEVLTAWCDDATCRPAARDELELATVLETLGRDAEALTRVQRGLSLDREDPELWLVAARLRERLGDHPGAAEALAACAERSLGPASARHLEHAAELVEANAPERALDWLREGAARDAGSARIQSALARLAERQGSGDEAERAAGRALDLAAAGAELDRAGRLSSALAGARCAQARGDLEGAARFATTARAIDASSPEVLAVEGRVLFALGEIAGARRALEARLAHAQGELYPERTEHLVLLASTLEAAGELPLALERFQEALALDSVLDDARAGVVRVHERAGRLDEARRARLAWAEHAAPAIRARQLARVAELELATDGDEAAAERYLRQALEADPACADACLLLATRLAESQRDEEALALTADALERAGDGDVRARLAGLRARILEQRGDRRAAADAYGVAADADARSASAALARARILRALGEWEAAAASLERFATRHPSADAATLAQVHFQRGRLLAGPLERIDAALDAYRRAIAANPRLRDGHAALAALLVHRQEAWDEALARHRDLLEADPCDATFLRGALRIAMGRNRVSAVNHGLAILRTLGVAAPAEREAAPRHIDARLCNGGTLELENPVWERARRLAQAASEEIARALDASPPSAGPGVAAAGDPRAAFRTAALAAQGRLSAPALVPLEPAQLAQVLGITAQLAFEAEHVRGDGNLVNALSRELGRRARRRMRREIEGVSPYEIGEIDFAAWQRELRGLAHAEALAATGGDLRSALEALIESELPDVGARPGPDADLTALVAAAPAAQGLLRRVVLAWLAEI